MPVRAASASAEPVRFATQCEADHSKTGLSDCGSVSGATRASPRSPAVLERIQVVERARALRSCGSGVQATGHERREELATVGAR